MAVGVSVGTGSHIMAAPRGKHMMPLLSLYVSLDSLFFSMGILTLTL